MMYREGSHWLNYKGRLRLRDEGNGEKTRAAAAATNYCGDGVPNTDRINPFVDLKEAQSEEFVVFMECFDKIEQGAQIEKRALLQRKMFQNTFMILSTVNLLQFTKYFTVE